MVRSILQLVKAVSVALLALAPAGAHALDRMVFAITGEGADLDDFLKAASALEGARAAGRENPGDLFAAALSDYRNLTQALYVQGYYGGNVQIRIDGVEAAGIPLFAVPDRIGVIRVRIVTGPLFRFGRAEIAPLAGGTDLPPGFATGEPARATEIEDAVAAAILKWRDRGRASAAVADQQVVADHARRLLNVRITLEPGPVMDFGALRVVTESAVDERDIQRIAGLPSGEPFSDHALDDVAARLRRTGAFSSVSLAEAPDLSPAGDVDIELSVADAKPRRIGFGGELSSTEGLTVSGYWMHRNFMGGAERFRVDAEIANIDTAGSGTDYSLGARLERPAVLGPDTYGFVHGEVEALDEPSFTSSSAAAGVGVGIVITDLLTGEASLDLSRSVTEDALGKREFTLLSVPGFAAWDRRDNPLDPDGGFYLRLGVEPFFAIAGGDSGFRSEIDARYYQSFGRDNGPVVAARLRFGSVTGASVTGVDPGMLFYSGGGGSVRGQPYQSLGVDLGGGVTIGGRSTLGASVEARVPVAGDFAGVAFYDAGYVGAEEFYDGSGIWHSGAGVGLRYDTQIGPIRLDVAWPSGGPTGAGVQYYVGIGQAF